MTTDNKLPEEKTVAQRALELLKEVPADKFLNGEYTNGQDACCSVGHYKRLTSKDPSDFSRPNCDDYGFSDLRARSEHFLSNVHYTVADIATVNNSNWINGYTEPEIKDRVIHLLEDMVKAGY